MTQLPTWGCCAMQPASRPFIPPVKITQHVKTYTSILHTCMVTLSRSMFTALEAAASCCCPTCAPLQYCSLLIVQYCALMYRWRPLLYTFNISPIYAEILHTTCRCYVTPHDETRGTVYTTSNAILTQCTLRSSCRSSCASPRQAAPAPCQDKPRMPPRPHVGSGLCRSNMRM